MKKVLLTVIAAVAFVSGYAQQVGTEKATGMNMSNVATMAPESYVMEDGVSTRALAPKKTIETGTSYSRPDGSMWGWWGSSSGRTQMYLPFLAETKWINQSTDKTGAWTGQYNGEIGIEYEADEDGNTTYTIPKIGTGYINPYYVPYYTVGDDSYVYGIETGYTPWLFNGDSIAQVINVNGAPGYYYGFSDACVFGTFHRTLNVNGESVNASTYRVREFYKKPLAPLCIYSIEGRIVSYNNSEDMIPEGVELKAHFIRTVDGEYGPEETTDTIATMIITKDNITGDYSSNDSGHSFNYLEVSRVEEDIFGIEYTEPVIVDDQFVISIEGFEQEGVDFGFYMANVMATERDYYANGGVYPTLFDYVNDETGEKYDGYRQYNSGRQYNMFLQLNAITDIVSLYSDFDDMTAPVEGGAIYVDVTEENDEGVEETNRYATVQFQSTLPWLSTWEGLEGQENYYVEDLPDWLTIGDRSDSYYDQYNATLLQVIAEPLPDDVKGRVAKIRIVSDKGADSGVITVTQGTPDLDAIENVTENAAKKTNAVYNVAGQQVNNQFKGIVIENGKKVVR